MKKLINLFAIAGIACMATVACTKDGPDGPQPKPQGLTAPTLSVSPSSVVVSEESEDIALTFTWNDVSAEGITPVYGFQVTKKGDSEFASGTAFECPSTEKKFSHAELAALASEIGASINDGFDLIARVRVTAKDNKDIEAVLSNVVEVAVSKEQYPIQNIYPIGNGTPYGWSQDKTEPMEKSGSTFTWTGHLYGNAEFKFLLQNDGNWWPGIVNKTDDAYKYEPVLGFSDSDDRKFKVDKEGKYTITIDAANTNALKMKVEFIDDDIQTLVVDHLYILGGATKTGWSLDAMEEFEKNGNIFTWEGSLTEGGEFRFPMQRDWWPCLMIAMDGETLVKGVSDDEKTGYTVDETAIYKIVCDIDNMKVSINKTGDIAPAEFPTVFMCGDATPYGWNSIMTEESQLVPEDMGNVNVLAWTGELKASGTFKFLTCGDWVPSYNRDATASDYWTLAYRENYDQPDEQFKVSEDGTYKVVVDLDAMKVTCTKQGGDGFDFTPSDAYKAAGNLWKPVDEAKAVNYFMYMNIAPDWSNAKYDNVGGAECPFCEFNQSTYKLTFDDQTFDRWQNQFYIYPQEGHFIPLSAGKNYKFSVTLQSTESFGAFFKLVQYNPDGIDPPKHEGAAIWEPAGYPDNVVFEAGTPIVLEQEFAGVDVSNINLIFDFGKNPAGTVVYIKDITLTEV
ncbi:MAG: SusF/SusE family outer membrane protein [Bacteroidales bacterium]|nr:SusF/SusE family outer membrane protein [Bacteroidales bacterium]